MFCQFQAVHPGHHEVGNDKPDLRVVSDNNLQCILTICSFEYSIAMPPPVSETVNSTYCPGFKSACLWADASEISTFLTSIESWPPAGMASRAFIARFRMI